jgi:hypothetical protein
MHRKDSARTAITSFISSSGRTETTNNSRVLTTSRAKEGTSKLIQIICADNVAGRGVFTKSMPPNASTRIEHIMSEGTASSATKQNLNSPEGRLSKAMIPTNFIALIQSVRMVSRFDHMHTICVSSAAGIKVSINHTRQNALTLIDHIKERGFAPNATGLITTITRARVIQEKRHLQR